METLLVQNDAWGRGGVNEGLFGQKVGITVEFPNQALSIEVFSDFLNFENELERFFEPQIVVSSVVRGLLLDSNFLKGLQL